MPGVVIQPQGDYLVVIDQDNDNASNRFAVFKHTVSPVELFAVDQGGGVQLRGALFRMQSLVLRNVGASSTPIVIFEGANGEVARITPEGRMDCEKLRMPAPLANEPTSGVGGDTHLVQAGTGAKVVMVFGNLLYRLSVTTPV